MNNENYFKLDLHVHAAERSGCATAGEEAMIRAAIEAGLHGIAFTDHHALVDAARLDELNSIYHPFRIYSGIEITTAGEDWLVLGLRDPLLSRAEGWEYPELRRFVRERGGFIALAHPFRYNDQLHLGINGSAPDGIEYRSNNTPVTREAEIRSIAANLGTLPLCNSDAHSTRTLGKYFNLVDDLPQDDRELVRFLLNLKK
jgi:predicted metal-dependent phosphoesterase TrpH